MHIGTEEKSFFKLACRCLYDNKSWVYPTAGAVSMVFVPFVLGAAMVLLAIVWLGDLTKQP